MLSRKGATTPARPETCGGESDEILLYYALFVWQLHKSILSSGEAESQPFGA